MLGPIKGKKTVIAAAQMTKKLTSCGICVDVESQAGFESMGKLCRVRVGEP